jgi:antitoxin component HigA of HigAB toxin-antitoxin module
MKRYELDDFTELNPEVRSELFYEVFKDFMDERNWGFTDLDYESGCHGLKLFELLHKKRPLTDELAECLAKGFGTSAELWKNLYEMTINKPGDENDK